MLAAAWAAPVAAQAAETQQPAHRVIVPLVGDLTGWQNVHWRATVTLTNSSSQDMFVGVTLVSPGYPAIALSLGPGESTVLDDVTGQAFNFPGRAVALEIATLGPRPVAVATTVVGQRSDGKLTSTMSVPTIAPGRGAGLSMLSGLVANAKQRTTLGIENLGEEAVTVTVAIQRLEGRSLATTVVTIPPLTLYHAPIEAWFPLIQQLDDFAVIVDSPSSSTYAYACVVDNKTHDPQFVSPTTVATQEP